MSEISLFLLKSQPIPDLSEKRERRLGYRQYPIDLNDPRNQQPLVEAQKYGLKGENFYHRKDSWYGGRVPGSISELYLREGVAEEFAKFQTDVLKPLGLQIWIDDAWRPQDVQRYFHDEWFPQVIKTQNPSWSEDKVIAEVEKFWAKPAAVGSPIDYNSPSPHSTGAVLDLRLADHNGHPLEIGTVFNDVRAAAFPDYYENYDPSKGYDFTALSSRDNRRAIFHIWEKSKFVQNPNEVWHVSYGDQLWAKIKGEPAAFYSYTEPK